MRCIRLFLPFLLAALHTTQVVGFGFGGGHGKGYVQESAGGLVVDPQDQAERERINAEMDANAVTYGEETEQLFTYFKSKDGQVTLNMSCSKSALVFEQEESPLPVGCNLTYDFQRSIALSFEIDYPPVVYLAPAFWLHLQPTASSGPSNIYLNLTIQGVRMGVAYLRIWAREAIEEEKSGAGVYVWHNWSRSDPVLVEAYLSKLANRSEIAFGIAMLVPIKPEFGFGLLTVGCSPGGAGSNVWTLLLHGDLNLSMTMTFISSVAALVHENVITKTIGML
ncbi:unnamed protein product [Dibothriocephalus latus]|uniref:Uncharacterized protein n=1 Tax=Dibothriocephalus latus TaxID=60516 RepID=A0A3P7NTM4_DIBLA|nr:unnamed protein product [Dibothriocephalus latus]